MPNRIVRDAILESDRYHGLSHDSERLLFLELLLVADDFGLVPLNPAFLRRRTTPCTGKTAEQLAAMVSALADADLIRTYESEGGGRFGYIPRFKNHPRATKPKWPLPPSGEGFREINELAGKRITYAKQLQTNAPETETETETEEIKDSSANADVGTSPDVATQQIEAQANGKVPPCPIAQIIDLYHAELPVLPRLTVRTAKRNDLISQRWRQVFTDHKANTRAEGVELFRNFFAFVRESKFLTGKTQSNGRSPFRCDLEWLMNASNFAKTVEGRYHQ